MDSDTQLRTEAEKDADRALLPPPEPSGDLEPRIEALENKVDEIVDAQVDALHVLGVEV